jgi:hypothetical protein
MMTLRLFSSEFESVPAATSWYLADLGEARGKQELFTRQSPQRLRVLREHEGKHDPWPYINYLLSILKMAYREFEDRMGRIKSPRGAKTELIARALMGFSSGFSVRDLERACPGVSRDMVRRVLRDLQARGDVECLGRGPGALWRNRKKRQCP